MLICTNRTNDVHKQALNLNRSGRRWPRGNVRSNGKLPTHIINNVKCVQSASLFLAMIKYMNVVETTVARVTTRV